MGQPHVISALVAKRAELSGKMLDLDRQKAALKAQLRHIDHTLAIFGYADPPRDIAPKQPRVYRFKRRELSRLLLDMERDGISRTNREIALQIMSAKGWDTEDRALVAKVTDSVKSAKEYRRQRERGVGASSP
jgi:hypothetical protein